MKSKFQWIDRKHQELPEYDWVILGFDVEEENDSAEFAWQIGRRIGSQIEFWGAEKSGGPFQGDAFWTWKPENSTHWLQFNPYEIEIFQPERSKREDLDCCKKVKDLCDVLYNIHWEWCAFVPEDMMQTCENDDCGTLRSLITEYKMRCSEHCGNTVRDK